jgi:hypothetical protein
MKTCRWVLLCVLLVTCLCGCSILGVLLNLVDMENVYPFHADITFADLSPDLYWNEAPADTREYAWGLKIDYDANVTTGEPPEGFDVMVWITYLSDGTGDEWGGLPLEDNPHDLAGTTWFTPEFRRWDVGAFELEPDNPVAWDVYGNTIHINFHYQNFDTAPAAGYRTRFFASYYPPPAGPEVTNETSIATETESITDPAGNAGGYSFIDIVSAQLSHIPRRQ